MVLTVTPYKPGGGDGPTQDVRQEQHYTEWGILRGYRKTCVCTQVATRNGKGNTGP